MRVKRKLAWKITSIIGIICFLTPLAVVWADTPGIWGELTPGPYGIGFKSVERYDYSRVFQLKSDYYGEPVEGERARPIQINIWYPAVKDDNALTMVYGEYSFSYPTDIDFNNYLTLLHNREITRLFGLAGNINWARSFMDEIFYGVRDADMAEGNFPLLIYFPSRQSNYCDNAVLCEFLASHGFVVAAAHPVGLRSINVESNMADLESIVRDGEFIFDFMRDYNGVNKNLTGTFGWRSGGTAALLMQMRNVDIDAVAGLGDPYTDSSYNEFLKGNSFFDLRQVRKPLMYFHYNNEETDDMSLLDSMIYSDRYACFIDGGSINDFSMNGSIRAMAQINDSIPADANNPNYEIVCQYVKDFFAACLTADDTADKLAALTGDYRLAAEKISFKITKGAEIPPTPGQLMTIIRQQRIMEAVEIYERFNKTNPGSIRFDEATFNNLGYQLLARNQLEESQAIMRLNVETYPESPNCYDSYADALLAEGKTDEAANCYKKVLELLDSGVEIDDGLASTLRTNAENFLNDYQETNN
jgi:tetratricopeptide (TPR) repeat protein